MCPAPAPKAMFPAATKAGGTCFGFPDVCKVPSSAGPVPTPFPNTGQCRDAQGAVDSILVQAKAILVESSKIPMSSGDEAGTAGGILSGMFMGPVVFKTACSKVYAKGKRVVMMTATTGHNGICSNQPAGMHGVPSQTKVMVGG